MDIYKLTERLRDLPERSISYYDNQRLARKLYPELLTDVKSMQARLEKLGVKCNMRIGILAANCYQWVVADLALLLLRCICVSFPPEEVAGISLDELAEEYALNLMLISERELKRRGKVAEWVASLEGATEGASCVRQSVGQDTTSSRASCSLHPDVLTLVFSSGTSGKLKCLKISKRGTEEWIAACGRKYTFKPDDSMIVVLPLSNYQQRLMVYTAIWYGFDLLLTEPARFLRGLKEMQPTILAGPPAFYEAMENRFRNLPPHKQFSLSAVGWIIRTFTFEPLRSNLLGKWFEPFHSGFGGRIRLLLVGSAPSRRSTLDLFGLLGLPLYEVYGLGETGFVSLNLPGANRPGSVGKPMFEAAVTLADDGEIIVRYEHPLSRGYFNCDKDEELETFLDSQRIATGDIGRFDEDGYLYIIGRKKQIIITQGGYKVQPEALENEIEKSSDVSRVVIFGGGELSVIAAVVSLSSDNSQLTEKRVKGVIDRLNAKLPAACQIGRIVFTTRNFSTDNGFLTRNLKVDRRVVYEEFRNSLLNIE